MCGLLGWALYYELQHPEVAIQPTERTISRLIAPRRIAVAKNLASTTSPFVASSSTPTASTTATSTPPVATSTFPIPPIKPPVATTTPPKHHPPHDH